MDQATIERLYETAMRVVKGGSKKTSERNKRKELDANKEMAVHHVMGNLLRDAKKMESKVVNQILEDHVGRPLTFEDIPKIERITTDNGYVLKYDMVMIGELRRFHHKDKNEEQNYQITFQPFEYWQKAKSAEYPEGGFITAKGSKQ